MHACSVNQSCPTLCDFMDCSLPVSSVYGVFQARMFKWVSISSSRGSSQPKDRTPVSPVSPALDTRDKFFTIEAPGTITDLFTINFHHFVLKDNFKCSDTEDTFLKKLLIILLKTQCVLLWSKAINYVFENRQEDVAVQGHSSIVLSMQIPE